MQYDIPQAHISQFFNHGLLPLEGVLSETELSAFPNFSKLKFLSYIERRDLFQRHQELAKIFSKRKFREMIQELKGSKELRLISDELFIKEKTPLFPYESLPIDQLFPFQNIVIGILLPLGEPSNVFDLEMNPGDAMFINPNYQLPIQKLCSTTPHYLAVYGTSNTLYVYREKDPAGHTLKNKNYSFGDRLRSEDYPAL
jgi:hypothetical protein